MKFLDRKEDKEERKEEFRSFYEANSECRKEFVVEATNSLHVQFNNASFVSRERVTVSVLFSLRKESERKELIDPLTCTTVPRPRP